MATSQKSIEIDEKQLSEAQVLWERFIKLSKVACIATAVTLVLLALFLL